MNGLESIKSVNANADLRIRAQAYATNNPGVSVDEAVVILAGEDAIAKRKHSERVARAKQTEAARAAHSKNRNGE